MNTIFLIRKVKEMGRFVVQHGLVFSMFVFFILFSFAVSVFATPPVSTYNAGETLNPTCAPGSTNCAVGILPDQTGNSGMFLTTDGSVVSWGTVTQNTFSTGLTNTSGTVTNDLSTGITGGQDIYGGVDAGDTLTLNSTTNVTKGKIIFGISAYDEVNNRLGIGTTTPQVALDVTSLTDGVYGRFQAREGTYQAAFTFNNGLQEVWFFGKQTDDSFIVYDSVAHKYKFRVVSDGSILLGEDGTTNVSVGSTADTSMFNVGSNGEFQVDSTGAIAAATGITTSGNVTFSDITEGSILFAGTGGLVSQDNTNFFWNNTTNKLGIGTASPSAFMHVLGITEQLRLGYDASNYLSTTISSTGSATFDLTGTSPTFIFGKTLSTATVSGPALRDVAGSSTPSLIPRKDDLTTGFGASGTGRINIVTGGTDAGAFQSGRYDGSHGNGPSFRGTSDGTIGATLVPDRSSSTTGLGSGASGQLALYIAGTEKIRLNSTGIGITCAAPDHLLEIGGTGAGCNTGAGSYLNAAGDTTFTANSSRVWKDNITTVEKENILDLIASTPVRRYDWKPEYCDGPQCLNKIGFIAEEFYPVLEHGDNQHVNGQDVSMAEWLGLQKLIQVTSAMDLKIQNLNSLDVNTSGTFGYMVKTLLADTANTITDMYAKIVHADRVETNELCVGTTCITEAQFLQMVNQNSSNVTPVPPTSDPIPTPDPAPTPDPVPTDEPVNITPNTEPAPTI